MTRRDIILQILSEATALSSKEAEALFEEMVAEGMIGSTGLDEEFSRVQAEHLLDDFREELPGIRRWLCETGLMGACGHA